jgi:hypothetical protein
MYSLQSFVVILLLVLRVQDRGQAVEMKILQWRIQFDLLTEDPKKIITSLWV